MPTTVLTRAEAAERARLFRIDDYRIEIDLTAAATAETFGTTTSVRFGCAEPGAASFIDLVAAEVLEITLNGRPVDPALAWSGARIRLDALEAENELRVVARGRYSQDCAGLHRFTDPVDGQVYVYSQFEVDEARRVFAVFDQPDLKAAFSFTVLTPASWRVIGTMPSPEPEAVPGGGGRHVMPATPRLASYVTAVIAGPYTGVSTVHRARDRSIPLGVYCRASQLPLLDADALLPMIARGLDYFEERFGHPYPFTKFDLVFVPEFSAGAMENAAAVTIRDQYLFRSQVTGNAFAAREATVLHELAHMWFGDLVTLRWWDDLWLNESFATYAALLCQSETSPEHREDVWTAFAVAWKNVAYLRDQSSSTHPVTADITDLDDVQGSFDGITYIKGASVLRQLAATLGADVFFRGLSAYLHRHAWSNATAGDLVAALEEASGRALGSWTDTWLRTSGVNTLRPDVTVDERGRITSFAVLQDAPEPEAGARGAAVLRPHRIAIGCYESDGAGRLVRTERHEIDVDGARTEVPALHRRSRPAVFLLNDDDVSYTRTRFDAASFAVLTRHAGDLADPMAGAAVWSVAWDMTREGELAACAFVAMVTAGTGRELDIATLQTLHGQAREALDGYADPELAGPARDRWADHCRARLSVAPAGSGSWLAWFQALVGAAWSEPHRGLLTALLDGTAAVDGVRPDVDLRWQILRRLAASGAVDGARIDAELERDGSAAGVRQAAACRAALPEPAAKAAAWEAVLDPSTGGGLRRSLISGFVQPGQHELLAPYVPRYFEAVERLWAGGGREVAHQVVGGLYPVYAADARTLAASDEWLGRTGAGPALRRQVLEGRATVVRLLRTRAADRAAAAATRER
ncbi:aminopeptidase N [Kitasatospora aureofaciens]|uniref:aminopeptidase N n=1 Tax=Kitasatospora aureofaciens TaxID=1894 RepID=UPI001D701BC6|nr:aminopeptidase N [Kitasatospora aureofaciens]HJD81121.1 aminopeptidase N [Kitasatospora aureofaciens]